MFERFDRIEWIGKAVPIRGARHELRDAFGAFAADGERVETALLPDHAGEELDRQAVLRRVLFDCAADIVGGRRILRSAAGGVAPACALARALKKVSAQASII